MSGRPMIFGSAAALLLAGCSDPKAATEANFQSALQKWFDAHPECISLGYEPLKVQVSGYEKTGRIGDALAKAGLVTREEGTETSRAPGGGAYKVIRYRPTAKAGDAIRPSEDRFLGGTNLCFAHRQIDEVTGFTEPGDMMGVRVSQVSYRYRLRDLPSWINDPNIHRVLPGLDKSISTADQEGRTALVLTNDGWAHEQSLRK